VAIGRHADETAEAGSATVEQPARRDRRSEILRTAAAVIASSGTRASIQEIADAAGLSPGSLYHHFESKEAILVELMRDYHADMGRIALDARSSLEQPGSSTVADRVFELSAAIVKCALEHRAAVQMSLFQAPTAYPELNELVQRKAMAVEEAMLQTLVAGRWSGYIRSDVDLGPLADRFCQTMLHAGLEHLGAGTQPEEVAKLLCTILTKGLAARSASDELWDRSAAMAAADETIATWSEQQITDPNDKAARVREAAREQFGLKGYEVTTIRDIAAAAGLATGTVYQIIGPKEELLATIMRSFAEMVGEGWQAILHSDSGPVEKLDALSWININALQQFPDEFRIQLAWLRQAPPANINPGWLFVNRLDDMKVLLEEGLRIGDIEIDSPSTELLARCVIDVQWIPENILRDAGRRGALIHARDTVLRGVAKR
jgi:AcrR family transcriptional regulator